MKYSNCESHYFVVICSYSRQLRLYVYMFYLYVYSLGIEPTTFELPPARHIKRTRHYSNENTKSDTHFDPRICEWWSREMCSAERRDPAAPAWLTPGRDRASLWISLTSFTSAARGDAGSFRRSLLLMSTAPVDVRFFPLPAMHSRVGLRWPLRETKGEKTRRAVRLRVRAASQSSGVMKSQQWRRSLRAGPSRSARDAVMRGNGIRSARGERWRRARLTRIALCETRQTPKHVGFPFSTLRISMTAKSQALGSELERSITALSVAIRCQTELH